MAINIQIIVGTYDKILHGTIAALRDPFEVEFLDNFLFEAHTSAVRCLALSPSSSSPNASERPKIILASGGSDEKINLYHIAASPLAESDITAHSLPSLKGKKTLANPGNRELGALFHHNAGVNVLYFPTRSKLLSGADDNTIAVTRTRDWTVLSSIKAPIPKAHGRPSGDTAPLGATPAGVNDFAVHPSMKLMVSVGKGEKCMRLWNLITGKKAGVLNFEKELLREIGGGKWGSGEGRKIGWNAAGDEFLVAFEKGAVIFGLDCQPKARIIPHPLTKVHQIRYTEVHGAPNLRADLIAISTEDSRILLYLRKSTDDVLRSLGGEEIPTIRPIGELRGNHQSRVKDLEILAYSGHNITNGHIYVISAGSDGAICVWLLDTLDISGDTGRSDLSKSQQRNRTDNSDKDAEFTTTSPLQPSPSEQAGKLIGKYETGHRITCLKAFVMSGSSPKHTMPPNKDDNVEKESHEKRV